MLRRHRWEKTKEKLQHCRRRTPEASVLYQIVYHSRDDLQFQWEARFQHQYGCLPDEVLKTFDEYLNCGILAHGLGRELLSARARVEGSRTVPLGYIVMAASTRFLSRSLNTTESSTPSSFVPLGERSLRCSASTNMNLRLSSPCKLPVRH